jgi:hypothetical protein
MPPILLYIGAVDIHNNKMRTLATINKNINKNNNLKKVLQLILMSVWWQPSTTKTKQQ